MRLVGAVPHPSHPFLATHRSRSPGESAAEPYGLGVGTTGVIFAAIAIAWLAYLVPHFVRRRDDEDRCDESDPADRFSDSMRIVRHGTAPLLDQDLEEIETFEVSTPQTRRAAINDLRRLEGLASARRRRVLLALMAVLSAVIGLCGAGLIPWWTTAVPGGLLLIFVRGRPDQRPPDADKARSALSRDPPRQQRVHGLPQSQGVPDERRGCVTEQMPRPMWPDTRHLVGARSDHHADLRFQAPGAANRTHDRPLRSGRLVATATKGRLPQTLQPRPRSHRARLEPGKRAKSASA